MPALVLTFDANRPAATTRDRSSSEPPDGCALCSELEAGEGLVYIENTWRNLRLIRETIGPWVAGFVVSISRWERSRTEAGRARSSEEVFRKLESMLTTVLTREQRDRMAVALLQPTPPLSTPEDTFGPVAGR